MEGERGLVVDAPEAAVAGRAGQPDRQRGQVHGAGRGRSCACCPTRCKWSIPGPGLTPEDAARLFERGYRGTHAEHSQGGGIGLSIVRRLCALYGWNVRVLPGGERGVVATLAVQRSLNQSHARRVRARHYGRQAYGSTGSSQPYLSGVRAVEQAEEQFLHALRQRTRLAGSDLAAVDRADRRDLRRRAAHEQLVAQVQVFARQVALDHGDAVVARQR